MPFLSMAQRRTGRALRSAAVVADGTQTPLCTYLSAVLLVGLLLNATVGWAWADPVVGLVIAAVAAREGLEAWRSESCCAPGTLTATTTATHDAVDGASSCGDIPAPTAASEHHDGPASARWRYSIACGRYVF